MRNSDQNSQPFQNIQRIDIDYPKFKFLHNLLLHSQNGFMRDVLIMCVFDEHIRGVVVDLFEFAGHKETRQKKQKRIFFIQPLERKVFVHDIQSQKQCFFMCSDTEMPSDQLIRYKAS